MAAIPVSFTGVMWYPDLSVGVGPMPGGPGAQPPNWSPIHPSHPIANPWPPYVDAGPPGPQPPWPSRPPPSWSPIGPSHPIANPRPPYVDAGPPGPQPPTGGQPPLGIWGGPYFPPVPTHPIVLPPDLPPTLPPPDSRPIDWKTAWTPQTGWVVVGVPSGEHPTPSATPPTPPPA
jgi:hypothetical protein